MANSSLRTYSWEDNFKFCNYLDCFLHMHYLLLVILFLYIKKKCSDRQFAFKMKIHLKSAFFMTQFNGHKCQLKDSYWFLVELIWLSLIHNCAVMRCTLQSIQKNYPLHKILYQINFLVRWKRSSTRSVSSLQTL